MVKKIRTVDEVLADWNKNNAQRNGVNLGDVAELLSLIKDAEEHVNKIKETAQRLKQEIRILEQIKKGLLEEKRKC